MALASQAKVISLALFHIPKHARANTSAYKFLFLVAKEYACGFQCSIILGWEVVPWFW